MSKAYTVKLKRGTSEKTIRLYATSETNAKYLAEKQSPGFVAVDVRPA